MKLMMIELDAVSDNRKDLDPQTAVLLNRMRQKGNMIYFVSEMPRFHIKRNFFRFCNGLICNNGRLAFTCCENFVSRPLAEADTEMIRNEAAARGAGCALFDSWFVYYEGVKEGGDLLKDLFSDRYMKYGIPPKTDFFGAVLTGSVSEDMPLPPGMRLRRDGRLSWLMAGENDRLDAVHQTAQKLSLDMKDVVYIGAGLWSDTLEKEAGLTLRMKQMPEGTYRLDEDALRQHHLI